MYTRGELDQQFNDCARKITKLHKDNNDILNSMLDIIDELDVAQFKRKLIGYDLIKPEQLLNEEFHQVTMLGICVGAMHVLGCPDIYMQVLRSINFYGNESIEIHVKDKSLCSVFLSEYHPFLFNIIKYSGIKMWVIKNDDKPIKDPAHFVKELNRFICEGGLKKLELRDINFRLWPSDLFKSFAQAITKSKLTHLILSGCNIGGLLNAEHQEQFDAITQIILHESLIELDLSGSIIYLHQDDVYFPSLISAIVKNKIQTLNWDRNVSCQLDSERYAIYLQLFSHPNLQEFTEGSTLSGEMSRENFTAFCLAISKTKINSLEIYNKSMLDIESYQWPELINAIKTSGKITKIIGLPVDAPQALLIALKKNYRILNPIDYKWSYHQLRDYIGKLDDHGHRYSFIHKIESAIECAIRHQEINLSGLRQLITIADYSEFECLGYPISDLLTGLQSKKKHLRRLTLLGICIAAIKTYFDIDEDLAKNLRELVNSPTSEALTFTTRLNLNLMIDDKYGYSDFLLKAIECSYADIQLKIDDGYVKNATKSGKNKIYSVLNCNKIVGVTIENPILLNEMVEYILSSNKQFEFSWLRISFRTKLSEVEVNQLLQFFKKSKLIKLELWSSDISNWKSSWQLFCNFIAESKIKKLDFRGTYLDFLNDEQMADFFKAVEQSPTLHLALPSTFNWGRSNVLFKGILQNYKLTQIAIENSTPHEISQILTRNQLLSGACEMTDIIRRFDFGKSIASQVSELQSLLNTFLNHWPNDKENKIRRLGCEFVFKALTDLVIKLKENHFAESKSLLSLIPVTTLDSRNLYFTFFNQQYFSCRERSIMANCAFKSAVKYAVDAEQQVVPFTTEQQSIIDRLLTGACELDTLTHAHFSIDNRVLLLRRLLLTTIAKKLNKQQKSQDCVEKINQLPEINLQSIDQRKLQNEYETCCVAALKVILEIKGHLSIKLKLLDKLIQYWLQVKVEQEKFYDWKSKLTGHETVADLLLGLQLCLNQSGLFIVNDVTILEWDNVLLSHMKREKNLRPLAKEERGVFLSKLHNFDLETESPMMEKFRGLIKS